MNSNQIYINELANSTGTIYFFDYATKSVPVNVYNASGVSQGSSVEVVHGYPTPEVHTPNEKIYWVAKDNNDVVVRDGCIDEQTFTITTQGSSIPCANTITALRSWQGATDGMIIALGGYYEMSDKPIVFYTYDADSAAIDNGGSVIECGSGAFLMNTPNGDVDLRHFGVFPYQTKASVSTDYDSQISACSTYVKSIGRFMSTQQGYYKLTTGVYFINGEGTLLGLPNVSCTVNTKSNNIKFYHDSSWSWTCKVIANEFATSQFVGNSNYSTWLTPEVDNFTFDSNLRFVVAGADIVKVNVNQNHGGTYSDIAHFEVANGVTFGGDDLYTFNRCWFNPNWTVPGITNYSCNNCQTSPNYFDNTTDYINFQRANLETPYATRDFYAQNTVVDGTLNAGNTVIAGTINASGLATLGAGLNLTGVANIAGGVYATGMSTFPGNMISLVEDSQHLGVVDVLANDTAHGGYWNMPVGTVLYGVSNAGACKTIRLTNGQLSTQLLWQMADDVNAIVVYGFIRLADKWWPIGAYNHYPVTSI